VNIFAISPLFVLGCIAPP